MCLQTLCLSESAEQQMHQWLKDGAGCPPGKWGVETHRGSIDFQCTLAPLMGCMSRGEPGQVGWSSGSCHEKPLTFYLHPFVALLFLIIRFPPVCSPAHTRIFTPLNIRETAAPPLKNQHIRLLSSLLSVVGPDARSEHIWIRAFKEPTCKWGHKSCSWPSDGLLMQSAPWTLLTCADQQTRCFQWVLKGQTVPEILVQRVACVSQRSRLQKYILQNSL